MLLVTAAAMVFIVARAVLTYRMKSIAEGVPEEEMDRLLRDYVGESRVLLNIALHYHALFAALLSIYVQALAVLALAMASIDLCLAVETYILVSAYTEYSRSLFHSIPREAR